MIAETDKKWSRIIAFFGLILLLIYLASILTPIVLSSRPALPINKLMSNMKQIGTSLMIYYTDYDGLLPNTQTRDQLITALEPYTKNPQLFEPVQDNFHLPIQFNANLAGVNIDLPKGIPLADKTNFLPPSQAVMLYAIITKKDESPAFFTYADTSTKALPQRKPFNPADIFAPQFHRSGTLLQGQRRTK
jgi:hypothetical protein